MAGRAGQPDPVGFRLTGAGIDDAGQAREADRQAVEILDRRRLQAGHGLRRRPDIGRCQKAEAAKASASVRTVFGLGMKPNRSR